MMRTPSPTPPPPPPIQTFDEFTNLFSFFFFSPPGHLLLVEVLSPQRILALQQPKTWTQHLPH